MLRVETAAALFYRSEMKGRSVGDCLDMRGGSQVGICPGNGGPLACRKARDGLGKLEVGIEVRILIAAAVTGVPTCIQSELHEVGQAHLSAGTGGSAAR